MDHTENDKRIDEFLTRGIENIYPNREFVEARLRGKKPVTAYLGIDPTGPTLHLGHAILLKKLKELQDMGHKVILLIGDFTATIGDPTDKLAARKQLTRKEVLENARVYKKQTSVFLRFFGRNKAQIRYNSKWYNKMKMEDVLALSANMTVEQMLKRDMFQRRMEEGKPVYIHEFLYPLMQGYDSVVMDVDGEIGGNDQTFNMLAGRTLMKQLKNKEKFVLSMKLLADKEGKKMGKTEGNMVALSDTPEDMYGKIMSWTDGMIIPAFELCTFVSIEEVKGIEREMARGVNPRDAKMRLAREIVAIYHGEEKAQMAQGVFVDTFRKQGIPENTKEVVVEHPTKLSQILLENEMVTSKTDFRRLVREGAIKTETGEKIEDEHYAIDRDNVFRIGKRRFIKVKIR